MPDHELLKKIGDGSYGEVWLARNAVGTLRAVKIVHRKTFWSDHPFEREFNGIQKFEPISRSHEGLVDVLQIGRGDGYFYYVMELADDGAVSVSEFQVSSSQTSAIGQQLETRNSKLKTYAPRTLTTDLARHRRLPPAECIRIGLAHLHRHGLVHRDIKPANIIFVGGVPKLADIGLVAEASEARSYVGTEGFIPPEGPGSPQADLYSLGKLLYEISTGQDRHAFPVLPPDLFSGSARGLPLQATLAHRMGEGLGVRATGVERAGVRAGHASNSHSESGDAPDSPATADSTEQAELKQLVELNAILLKACRPDPRERYSSAEAMHAELQLLQRGGSVRRRRILQGRSALAKMVALVAATVFLLGAGVWLLASRFNASMTQRINDVPEVNSIAVLPVVNERKIDSHDYLCAALTEQLIQVLTNGAGLRVVPQSAVLAFKDRTNDLAEAGRQLGVRTVLTAGLWRASRGSNAMELQARIVNVEDGAELWSETFTRGKRELGQLGSDVARAAARTLGVELPEPGVSLLETNLQREFEAYRLSTMGWERLDHSFQTKSNFTEAVHQFQQALSADPDCFPAHLGLGAAYKKFSSWHLAPREAMPTARNHLVHALELSPGSVRARAMLGVIRLHYDYDLPGAERDLRHAVALDRAQSSSALLCYLWAAGRWDEAESVALENRRNQPDTDWPASELAGTYYFQRRYDLAMEQVRWMQGRYPQSYWPYLWASRVHLQRGEFAEALAALATVRKIENAPGEVATEGYIYGRMGRRDDALRVMGELERLSTQRFVSKDCWALLHLGLGDHRKAIDYLEQAADQRVDAMMHLNIDPLWDPIRDEPGFVSLVQRLGLGK